ncbi:hypothetical protein AHiyo6_01070 [Arthrobacter sp. Hiyo6]|nr:hypothetical protein AHiyo6_01070 [Arthrobacter sp. Hiyo6]
MPDKRLIVDTPNGPALIHQPAGMSVIPFQATATAEIAPSDAEWDDLHKKLKTGKLDFATVKKEHGITGEQTN